MDDRNGGGHDSHAETAATAGKQRSAQSKRRNKGSEALPGSRRHLRDVCPREREASRVSVGSSKRRSGAGVTTAPASSNRNDVVGLAQARRPREQAALPGTGDSTEATVVELEAPECETEPNAMVGRTMESRSVRLSAPAARVRRQPPHAQPTRGYQHSKAVGVPSKKLSTGDEEESSAPGRGGGQTRVAVAAAGSEGGEDGELLSWLNSILARGAAVGRR